MKLKTWTCPHCFREMTGDSVLFEGEHGQGELEEVAVIADLKELIYDNCFFMDSTKLRYRQIIHPRRYEASYSETFKTGFYASFGETTNRLCPHCHQLLPAEFGAHPTVQFVMLTTNEQWERAFTFLMALEEHYTHLGLMVTVATGRNGDCLSVLLPDGRQVLVSLLRLAIDELERVSSLGRQLFRRQVEKSDGLLLFVDHEDNREQLNLNLAFLNAYVIQYLPNRIVSQPSLISFDQDSKTSQLIQSLKTAQIANYVSLDLLFQDLVFQGQLELSDIEEFLLRFPLKKKGLRHVFT